MDQNEEDVIAACGAYLVLQEEKNRKKRKYWVHQLWRARDEEGEFHTIYSRLKDDQDKFFTYFRMSKFHLLLIPPLLYFFYGLSTGRSPST